jgi:hypothetical protein
MLGGVAHRGTTTDADVAQLFAALRLPTEVPELKFKQVARGAFDAVLKSPQIRTLLKWVMDTDLYIHFFNLNMEYWSFVDIIDDCVDYCLRTGKITPPFPGPDFIRYYHDFHKDALYQVIKAEKADFLKVVKRFGYPTIEGRETDFIRSLSKLVADHLTAFVLQTPRP